MFNINRRYIDFFMKWKFYILIILIMLITFFFYLFNDNNSDLKQNSQKGQSKLSDQQITNNKKLNKKEVSIEKDNTKETKIFIDIKGAVKHPNVYEMSSSNRVIDALNKAEVLKDADLSQLNLSEKLVDQKLIYVPKKGENSMKIDSQQAALNSSDVKINTNQPLNLNSATEEQLKNIPGIGPSKAKDILNYREKNNGFNSINDSMKIKGFGKKTFEKLKEHFTI
ncbi:helix-hairpin-helix domain-containing protein [Staphylococcus epidermidis]|uniref:helix-hairpin-helix domain-containing protein n=1 Tax=Staphylococcus epidermidis TaxID=1282 RepID=UPI000F87C398|nr:helix-hairpin-helix domain-containing protein [Staphylococcus epidermidis]RUN29227.1 competence protein ComE [Staphylococcus epidermidis]